MARLSKRTVDAAKVTGKEHFLWDDEMPGFGLRVLASGRKSYAVDRPDVGLPKAMARIMAKRVELDGVTAHVLRHSFASIADELGYTEATVAALLGQRSVVSPEGIFTISTGL